MEYPNSILSKPLRRGILIAFVALFCILAPSIIMYTSGYRYDWSRGLLRETGAINIDIEPASATVFLNGIKIKSKMPVRLNDRTPGKYNILISAAGFYDWQKDVEVKNKQTVYIKEIFMLQKNEPQMFMPGKITDIAFSFDRRYLAYQTENNGSTEVRVKKLSDGTDTLIYSSKTALNYVWAPNNSYLAVSDNMKPHRLLIAANADDTGKSVDLVAKTKYPIIKFQWKETAEPELYFNTDLRLMSYLPAAEQQLILSKYKWQDWYMENGQLWTITAASSSKQIKVVRDALGFSSDFILPADLAPAEQDVGILAAKNGTVLLKKNGLPEMIMFTNGKKFIFAGDKFLISGYNEWWIMWTPWEIWTYSPGGEPNLLNRSGEQLRQVVPLDKYNTLALAWADKTTALYPYYLVTHDLINVPVDSASADVQSKVLYFSAKIGGQEGVWKLGY